MTPKEKAKELFDKMSEWQSLLFKIDHPNLSHEYIKQCALIAVDEIINELKEFDDEFGFSESRLKYWQEVKEEINKL